MFLLSSTSQGSSTDERGEFVISEIHPCEVTVVASFVGFKKNEIKILVEQNKFTEVKILLDPVILSEGETIEYGQKQPR